MDYINILEQILPKMKLQMYSNKKIRSLDEVILTLIKFDPERKGVCPIYIFESFLSSIGIYLKTQEISELKKYLEFEPGFFSIDKFIDLFKFEKSTTFLNNINKVFEQLKNADNKISVDTLNNKISLKRHPSFQALQIDDSIVRKKFNDELSFVLGDKKEADLNDFVQLHCNFLCLMPHERIHSFILGIPEFWNCL